SLNDAFGHSGFRVHDLDTGFDVVFDYGRFPFHEPNFYLNFARGKLNYSIGASYYPDFIAQYQESRRTVQEQILNLSTDEQQRLYNFLLNNYKPENRDYLYDFFFDNCATKIKDVLVANVQDSIRFNTPKDYKEQTFRQLIQHNLNRNSWGSLGIDIALGAVIDRKATPEEQMFLPANIHSFFSAAKKGDTALVSKNTIPYQGEPNNQSSEIFSPLLILGLLALGIVYITYRDYKNKTRSRWLDVCIFTTTGLIGVGLCLLWFATDHTATANNYNLLWAFAPNLLVAFVITKKTLKPWVKKYLKLLLILLCLMVFHWLTGVQSFAPTLIPLLLALAVRYLYVTND
ncbi:MAG TPA: DUF4105 domain-containing protein, partial [Flavobacteriaceae bacterium]|nr:DUF4105 domain-containing protein [Flavobacteriaceae bacterium]